MKRFLTALSLILILAAPAISAHGHCQPDDHDPAKRQQWFEDMRRNKHEFLIRELDLTQAQQEPFFQVYDAMEDELIRIGEETRKAEKEVRDNENPTDADYDRAINELFELKGREYLVEKGAKEKLAKILTKRQLFKLKGAERKFFRALMKNHRPGKD